MSPLSSFSASITTRSPTCGVCLVRRRFLALYWVLSVSRTDTDWPLGVLISICTLIRPLLYLLSLPLIVLSLGLFLVVINALLLQLTAALVKGFTVAGFWASFWGALVISVVSAILNGILAVEHVGVGTNDRSHRPPTIINPD